MIFFKDDVIPSCSLCRYATEYIPYFTFRFSDPYCSKGHGQCGEDKLCGDFRMINHFYCEDCQYMVFENGETYCGKKNVFVDKFQTACAYIIKKEGVI